MSQSSNSWRDWPETQTLIDAFAGKPLRFVGGCVRDELLGRAVTDVDAATTLLPEQTAQALKESGHKTVPTGIAHGTVTAVIDGKGFEITTLRSDTACDGRHAKVQFTDDWKLDASRRDFTMNALYLSPEGELFDYFGGAEDAKAGRVRFIGDAGERIQEDYLRILRFFRFFAHYGKGEADTQALAACKIHAAQIKTLSGERIQHEMLKLLKSPRASAALRLMQQTNVLAQIMPEVELAALTVLERSAEYVPDAIVSLALLLRSAADPAQAVDAIANQWKLSNARAKRLKKLAVEKLPGSDISQAEQKILIRQLGAEDVCDLARIATAYSPNDEPHYTAMILLAQQWSQPPFPLTGNDLVAQGMTPGQKLGQILSQLEKQWEASGYRLSRDELLEQAKKL